VGGNVMSKDWWVADRKYAEAFADDIARELRDHDLNIPARVVFDKTAEAWAVQVNEGRRRHLLLMPAPGAIFAYFRNGVFVGGMGMRLGSVPPRAVSFQFVAAMLDLTTRPRTQK
jgi:hypothetical protein